jgi:hypothetical protein
VLRACEDFNPLKPDAQEALIQAGKSLEPLFA